MPRSDISWRSCGEGPGSSYERRPLVLRSALSLVPVDPSGSHDYSTRNAATLASGRLSPLFVALLFLFVRGSSNFPIIGGSLGHVALAQL